MDHMFIQSYTDQSHQTGSEEVRGSMKGRADHECRKVQWMARREAADIL